MKLRFKTSKTANFFFFVSNLSEWHFSCRPVYNKEWIKITGSLKKEEKMALEKFRVILQKYSFYLDKKGKTKYLGQKYSNFKLAPMLLDNINKGLEAKEEFSKNGDVPLNKLYEYFVWQLYPLAINYGRRKKKIDDDYI